jgi:hypothetical protein
MVMAFAWCWEDAPIQSLAQKESAFSKLGCLSVPASAVEELTEHKGRNANKKTTFSPSKSMRSERFWWE